MANLDTLVLAAAAILFVIVHVFCLAGTNDRSRPMARRAFLGARMAVHGLVVLIALSTLLVLLMQKGTTFKQVKPFLAILLIWIPSWIVHLGLLVSGTPRLIRPRLDD